MAISEIENNFYCLSEKGLRVCSESRRRHKSRIDVECHVMLKALQFGAHDTNERNDMTTNTNTTRKRLPRFIQRAQALGRARGKASADCQYLPGGGRDTARDAAGRAASILRAYDDGDVGNLGEQIPSWLSGEWADDPTARDVLADLGIDENDDRADDALSAYEEAATDAYLDVLLRHLRHVAKGGAS